MPAALPPMPGHAAVLAGSCSRATLGQIGYARASMCLCCSSIRWRRPMPRRWSAQALDWMADKLGDHAGGDRRIGAAGQGGGAAGRSWGATPPARWSSRRWRSIAEDLVARGVRRLVVAGGETAGAVVSRLGVRSLRIGAGDRSGRALDLCRRRRRRRCCWR